MTPEPHPRHKERGARAVHIAAAMCVYRSRLHHGEITADDIPRLDGVNGIEIPDVMDALGHMLAMQVGAPVTTVTTLTANEAWELAEAVAANADYDAEMFDGAARLSRERQQFWDLATSFEDGRDDEQ